MPKVRQTDSRLHDGGELHKLLRRIFGNAREEISKPIVRVAWEDSPDNLFVEMPEGYWLTAAPWMYEAFEVRLDPFMCDPYPEDL